MPCRGAMRIVHTLTLVGHASWRATIRGPVYRLRWGLLIGMLAPGGLAQVSSQGTPTEAATPTNQLAVNWLYGAYIPKDAPIVSLTGDERWKLYVRQSFTTPGIYIKTGFFAIHDQVTNSPTQWDGGIGGFAKRVGTRQAENLLGNSFTSLGGRGSRLGAKI
jgi:hypothetical protein